MSDRPLPSLRLPAAILRFWRGDLSETADELSTLPGVERLGEPLLAVVPTATRADLFHLAARLSGILVRRERQRHPADEPPGVLVFPGRILTGRNAVEPLRDNLFEDLLERAPQLAPGGITFTGWGAAWLRGRFELAEAGAFDGPSGRRVPLFEWVGDHVDPRPWHQMDVLGRHVRVPRPVLDRALVDMLGEPVVHLHGGIGVGKTRSLHKALDLAGREPEAARLVVGLGEALPGLPLLGRAILRWLTATLGHGAIDAQVDLGDTEAVLGVLAFGFNAAREHFGEPVRLVVDRTEFAEPADLDLLDALATVAEAGALRLVSLGRDRRETGAQLAVPPLDAVEMDALSHRLTDGLELPDAVLARLVEAAAGRPLMFEEMLWRLAHRGQMRRVYGSFFYAGDAEVEVE
ncbi:MAG: hypothetical protein AAGE94_21725, partial [Acidobacteriota bacterium]